MYITFLGFFDPLPPYVSMFLVLRISKNWHFLTPFPPPTSADVIYEWSPTKTNRTVQNHFGTIEGQGIKIKIYLEIFFIVCSINCVAIVFVQIIIIICFCDSKIVSHFCWNSINALKIRKSIFILWICVFTRFFWFFYLIKDVKVSFLRILTHHSGFFQ